MSQLIEGSARRIRDYFPVIHGISWARLRWGMCGGEARTDTCRGVQRALAQSRTLNGIDPDRQLVPLSDAEALAAADFLDAEADVLYRYRGGMPEITTLRADAKQLRAFVNRPNRLTPPPAL